MPAREKVAADTPREPRVSYAEPNRAAMAAEARIKELKETLETGVFSERERGELTRELMAAENALGRAVNPHLFR